MKHGLKYTLHVNGSSAQQLMDTSRFQHIIYISSLLCNIVYEALRQEGGHERITFSSIFSLQTFIHAMCTSILRTILFISLSKVERIDGFIIYSRRKMIYARHFRQKQFHVVVYIDSINALEAIKSLSNSTAHSFYNIFITFRLYRTETHSSVSPSFLHCN